MVKDACTNIKSSTPNDPGNYVVSQSFDASRSGPSGPITGCRRILYCYSSLFQRHSRFNARFEVYSPPRFCDQDTIHQMWVMLYFRPHIVYKIRTSGDSHIKPFLSVDGFHRLCELFYTHRLIYVKRKRTYI